MRIHDALSTILHVSDCLYNTCVEPSDTGGCFLASWFAFDTQCAPHYMHMSNHEWHDISTPLGPLPGCARTCMQVHAKALID